MKKIIIEINEKKGLWVAYGTDKPKDKGFGNKPSLALGNLILYGGYNEHLKSLGVHIEIKHDDEKKGGM